MTMVLTGLDVEEKAAHAETLLFEILGGREQFDAVDVQLLGTSRRDRQQLRVTVKDQDPREGRAPVLERRHRARARELRGLLHHHARPDRSPSSACTGPALVPVDAVEHAVVLPDGTTEPSSTAAPAPVSASARPRETAIC